MIINQYKLDALNLGLELYYSDTDSLVVNNPLPPEYCDSAKLGLLKLPATRQRMGSGLDSKGEDLKVIGGEF
jgi:hypothetical protein